MYLSFTVVFVAVAITYQQRTGRYFLLLLLGLAGGCTSTPFYYYFKAKEKAVSAYWGVDVKALSSYTEMNKKKK